MMNSSSLPLPELNWDESPPRILADEKPANDFTPPVLCRQCGNEIEQPFNTRSQGWEQRLPPKISSPQGPEPLRLLVRSQEERIQPRVRFLPHRMTDPVPPIILEQEEEDAREPLSPRTIAKTRIIIHETPESKRLLLIEDTPVPKTCWKDKGMQKPVEYTSTDGGAEQGYIVSMVEQKPSSRFYLNIGDRLSSVDIEQSGPARLNFLCNVWGFFNTSPGFIARGNQLFVMGQCAEFNSRKSLLGHEFPGMYVACCDDVDSSPLKWTVLANRLKFSAYRSYLVQVDDKICLFGGMQRSACSMRKWGCIFNGDTQQRTYLDLPRIALESRTLSHFLWNGKVYLVCRSKEFKLFVFSCDLSRGSCSMEDKLLKNLGPSLLVLPKIVVGDVLLVFNCPSTTIRYVFDSPLRTIRAYDLTSDEWLDDCVFDMEPCRPPPLLHKYGRDLGDFSIECLTIARLPAKEQHELYLLWQVGMSCFYGSRLRVQVKKNKDNKILVGVDVLEKTTKLHADRRIFSNGIPVDAIPLWS